MTSAFPPRIQVQPEAEREGSPSPRGLARSSASGVERAGRPARPAAERMRMLADVTFAPDRAALLLLFYFSFLILNIFLFILFSRPPSAYLGSGEAVSRYPHRPLA